MNTHFDNTIRRTLILLFFILIASCIYTTKTNEPEHFQTPNSITKMVPQNNKNGIIRGSSYDCPKHLQKLCESYTTIQNRYIRRIPDDELTTIFIQGITEQMRPTDSSKSVSAVAVHPASFTCGVHTQKLCDAYDTIRNRYDNTVSDNKLTEMFIQGAINEIRKTDVYSKYIPAKRKSLFSGGYYSGIGLVTGKDKTIPSPLVIRRVVEGSPAHNAKLGRGDKITHVNGISILNKNEKDSNALIRENGGSRVKLTVIKGCHGKVDEIILKRAKIHDEDSGKLKIIDGQYAYVLLDDFDGNVAGMIRSAIKQFRKSYGEPKGLIIDLRNNPGGFVIRSVELSGIFMGKGVVLYEQGQDGRFVPWETHQGSRDIIPEVHMVVLVNDDSASASEIFAGAMQDSKRAIINGTNTYGKGVMQTTLLMKDGSKLYLTIAHTFTPNKNAINKVGIYPDAFVPEGKNESCTGDEQLATAIRLLSEKR
jgi:carboxyl-terminal processing protease